MRLQQVRTTALCFLMAVCAWGAYFYGNSFYMVALADAHGWGISQISSAITLGFWSCIPASLVVGWVFDLHGRRWGALAVVAYGAIALAVGIWMLGRVDELWQLQAVYMLMGSAYPALAAPAISATLNQRVGHGHGWALSVALTGASVGGALAAPALVWANARFGLMTTTTGLACLVAVVLLPGAVWILRPIPIEATNEALDETPLESRTSALGSALRGSCFWRIVIAALLSLAAQVGFLAHQLSVLTMELSSARAALLVSATAISSALGRFMIAALARSVPLRHLACLTYVAMSVGIGIVALSTDTAFLFVGCLLTGLFVGAVVLLPPLLCRCYFEPAIYARVYGFIAIGVYAGGGLGPSIAGLMRDVFGDAQFALLSLAALSAVAGLIVNGLRSP